jgi:hypothetical protein
MKLPFGIPPFQSPEGWAKRAKVEHIGKRDENMIIDVTGIRVTRYEQKPFAIPVLDSRRESDRERIANITKVSNGPQSKYFRQSYSIMGPSYNIKRKP